MSMIENIKSSILSDGLREEDISKLVSIAREMEYFKDATIFQQDDEEDCLYILIEGKIAIELRSQSGRHVGRALIQNVRRGQLIGEMGFIERRKRSATATAKSFVRLASFPFTDLQALIENDAGFGVRFLRIVAEILSRRLRRMNEQWIRVAMDDAGRHEFDYY